MAVRLFIGNLPYSASEADLREHFSAVAPPSQIVMPVDRETGRPRGFAFVDFPERSAAEEAIRRFDGQLFKGRTIAVSEARAREDRGPMGRPPGPMAPRPPAASPGGEAPAPGAPRPRTFGPDAAPRGKRRVGRGKVGDRGPKGPIRERTTGRVYAVDDDDSIEEVEFEDFATSASDGDTEDDES